MKIYLPFFTLILLVTTSMSKAQDYVWGEEFEEGDVISAATFNQIFDKLQKINQTITDEDLVGTWTCESIYTGDVGVSSGWTTTSFLQILKNSQVTLTASNAGNSESGPYSISTSSPNPISARDTADRNAAFVGTYILKNNNMYIKHGSADSIFRYDLDLISANRFTATLSPGEATSAVETFSCDSADGVLAAPTAAAATNAQTLVNITWTDNSSDETGFKIYRRLSNETEATELATAVTASPYSDSTLTEGQTAYYSVAAYNDNGVSAKSKVVSATLDSIGPTVASHTPTANQQVAVTNTLLSIYFSEAVNVICPDTGTVEDICPSLGNGAEGFPITATGSDGKTYNSIVSPIADVTSVAGYLNGSGGAFIPSSTITVTVHKEWIQDIHGNQMDADYTFTFTSGS